MMSMTVHNGGRAAFDVSLPRHPHGAFDIALSAVTTANAVPGLSPHAVVGVQPPEVLPGRLTATLTVTYLDGSSASTTSMDVPPTMAELEATGTTLEGNVAVWVPSDGGGHGLALATHAASRWTTPRVLVGTPLASPRVAATAHGGSASELVHSAAGFDTAGASVYLFTCPVPAADAVFSVAQYLVTSSPSAGVLVELEGESGVVRLSRRVSANIASVVLSLSGAGASAWKIAGSYAVPLVSNGAVEIETGDMGRHVVPLPLGTPTTSELLSSVAARSWLQVPTAVPQAIRVTDGNGLAFDVAWPAGVFAPPAMVSTFNAGVVSGAAAVRSSVATDGSWNQLEVSWSSSTGWFTFGQSGDSDATAPFGLEFLDTRLQWAFGFQTPVHRNVTTLVSDVALAASDTRVLALSGSTDASTGRVNLQLGMQPGVHTTVSASSASTTSRSDGDGTMAVAHGFAVGDAVVATSTTTGASMALRVSAVPSTTQLQLALPSGQSYVAAGHEVTLRPLCSAERGVLRWLRLQRGASPWHVPYEVLGLASTVTKSEAVALFHGGLLPRVPDPTPPRMVLVCLEQPGGGVAMPRLMAQQGGDVDRGARMDTDDAVRADDARRKWQQCMGYLLLNRGNAVHTYFEAPPMQWGGDQLVRVRLVDAMSHRLADIQGAEVWVTLSLRARTGGRGEGAGGGTGGVGVGAGASLW